MDDDGGLMWWAQIGQWLVLDKDYEEWLDGQDQQFSEENEMDVRTTRLGE